MERRKFLKQTGLATALLTTTGLPNALAYIKGEVGALSTKPRSEDWVLARYWEMHGLLGKGRKTTWLTGYTQPCKQHGWTLVERIPLDLKVGFRKDLPIPGSLIFDDALLYCYTEKKTPVGRLRVDYLERDMMGMTRMKLFLLELNGEQIGKSGMLSEKSAKHGLHVNWYCGIRKGDIAFRFKDAYEYGGDAYRKTYLEIWHKKGAQNFSDGVGC